MALLTTSTLTVWLIIAHTLATIVKNLIFNFMIYSVHLLYFKTDTVIYFFFKKKTLHISADPFAPSRQVDKLGSAFPYF